MQITSTLLLLVLLPLFTSLVNLMLGSRLPKALVTLLGVGSIAVNFIVAIMLFGTASDSETGQVVHLFNWISFDDHNIPFELLLDRLSAIMLLIINGVGLLIHIYSAGYMSHDKGYHRYFSYLNLFIFFMQMLVLGGNYVVTFIGWEGVGLSSYLLIGFWYFKHEYNNAAKKAFIMNRIGDLCLLLGLFLIFNKLGTLSYLEINSSVTLGSMWSTFASNPDPEIFAIAVLLFVGATGKSAQLPLFTWLPDAMAGPTPVSALIHAATMVTAGIFLTIRSQIFYELAPMAKDIILYVGLATALLAATIGVAQNDIKKVLAYSTVSQLGFMFIALGLGAYTTAFFHLLTHAFFKALLFLGSGSVIHAMGGEQDIRKMGGLRKKLPITFLTFLIGTLAISGIPPFAGFFSKDEILAKAFEHSPIVWGIAALSAAFTAFYMFRLLYLTFFGTFRGTEHQREHLHESPLSMTLPLIILAVFSTIAGFIGLPAVFSEHHWLAGFLAPVLKSVPAHGGHHLDHNTEYMLMGASVVIALLMAFIARTLYSKPNMEALADENTRGVKKLLANKYYFDEVYDFLIVKPVFFLSSFFYFFVESALIQGIITGTSSLVVRSGHLIRRLQTGNVAYYVYAMVLAIMALLALTIIPR